MGKVDMEIGDLESEPKKFFTVPRILLMIFVVLPIVLLVLFYNRNYSFKKSTNRILSRAPGPVGAYFKGLPTEEEEKEKIAYLSNYFLQIEPSIAADKIYIIKQDDDKIYTSIIRSMNQISLDDTQEILLRIRDIERREDLLFSVYKEAKEDEKSEFESEVSRLESQEALLTKIEIERRFSSKEFQNFIKKTDPASIARGLYFVDVDIKNYIMGFFQDEDRLNLESELEKIHNERRALKELAKFYETKPIEKAMETLGTREIYNEAQLALIYLEMSPLKSAEILFELEDDEFIEELFSAIMKEERLLGLESHKIVDISNAIEFLKDYSQKVERLAKVYGTMNASHISRIVEKMIKNDTTISLIDIDAYEKYKISDKVIIVDILSELKRDQVSKVLDGMNEKEAAEVTRLLAKPDLKNREYEGGESYEAIERSDPAEN